MSTAPYFLNYFQSLDNFTALWYSFHMDTGLRIRYPDEDHRTAINTENGTVFERNFGDESVYISVTEEPFRPTIYD